MIRTSTTVAAALLLASGTAHAQTASGNFHAEARCGPTKDQAVSYPFLGALLSHGECPDGGSGLASSNDASSAVKIDAASVRLSSAAGTNYFGTFADAGSGAGSTNITYSVNDIVFTNIANPGQTGIITVSMNFAFSGQVRSQGVSNCSATQPFSQVTFSLGAPGGGSTGSLTITGGGGAAGANALAAYPNDGLPATLSTASGGVDLTLPRNLDLIANTSANVLYCDDGPPAALGTADAFMLLRPPCGSPVFNLPAGYTVNSTQLGIVNNIWTGAAILQQPADVVACFSDTPTFSIVAAGPIGIQPQWQVEDAPGVWVNITADDNTLSGGRNFKASGPQTQTLSLAPATGNPIIHLAASTRFRCAITTDCGSRNSDPATLLLCLADRDCDHIVDLADYFEFFNCFDQTLPCADVNGDSVVDLSDYFAFFNAFDTSC